MRNFMLSQNNLALYLDIINCPVESPTLSYLKKLQSAHLENFVFSSLSVLLKDDLSLDSQKLFERIVVNKSGGYCFEQNKIFFEILQLLGFKCELSLGRVLNNKVIDVPRTHRITQVNIRGEWYLTDVGFGPYSPREPLALHSERPQNQGDAIYIITKPDQNNYTLSMQKDNAWFILYTFDTGHYTEADCLSGHHFSSTYPEANFVKNMVVSLKGLEDIRSLKNGLFFHIKKDETEILKISSSEILNEVLREQFQIKLPQDKLTYLYDSFCK